MSTGGCVLPGLIQYYRRSNIDVQTTKIYNTIKRPLLDQPRYDTNLGWSTKTEEMLIYIIFIATSTSYPDNSYTFHRLSLCYGLRRKDVLVAFFPGQVTF